MERLNKEGLAYYHSLIKGMFEVTPEDNEAITEMVLGTDNYINEMTQDEYDSLSFYDPNALYLITS